MTSAIHEHDAVVDNPQVFLESTVAYGLAAGATIHSRQDTLFLLLKFPLKFTALHRSWLPLFQSLTRHPVLGLDELAKRMPEVAPGKIAGFLDQLMYKGFLVRTGHEGLTNAPLVSIIIPVRNRPREIGMCLEAIGRVKYPAGKIEVIVVDDASTDSTPDTAAGFPVRLIRLKRHKQAAFCRNSGARQAGGDILAFIDSDCIAHPDWLWELVPAFADEGLAAVGGRIAAFRPRNKLDWYEHAKSSLMVSAYARQSAKEDPFFYVPACNLLIRRRSFLDLNGFDVGLSVGEDVDLCWRLQDSGRRLAFRPAGIIFHQHRNRLAAFCSRRYQYGTSEPLLQKRHPARRKSFLAPPAAVAVWLCLILWGVTGAPLFAVLGGLIVLGDSLRRKRRLRPVPVATGAVIASVLRGYGAFGYHLSAFCSRYYLIFGLLCLPLQPLAAAVVLAMHLIHCCGEYILKKPRLILPTFFFYFTLEQLCYQAGVWRACARHGTLKPVLPRIITKSRNL